MGTAPGPAQRLAQPRCPPPSPALLLQRCLPSYGRKGKACVFCDPALHMVVNPRSQQ